MTLLAELPVLLLIQPGGPAAESSPDTSTFVSRTILIRACGGERVGSWQ